MRSPSLLAALTVVAMLGGATLSAQETPVRNLALTFHEDGLVSLSASHVTLREILAEWARQCRCYIVNGDRLAGGLLPVPLLYERMTQKKVLESLLRQAAGYVLTPKGPNSESVSNYQTIYILPASTAVAGAAPPALPPPVVSTVPPPTRGVADDEIAPVNNVPMNPAAIGQAPFAFRDGQMPVAAPGMATAAPGMAPGTQAPRPMGTVGVFVPIVPVNPGQTPAIGGSNLPQPPQNAPQSSGAPGMPSAPPMPMPVPIVPVAPQNR